jgi:kexin
VLTDSRGTTAKRCNKLGRLFAFDCAHLILILKQQVLFVCLLTPGHVISGNPGATVVEMKPSQLFQLGFTLASLFPQSTNAVQPRPRTYSTHHYYSLETSESTTLSEASTLAETLLGAELVEKIGELDGHWLVRSERSTVDKRDQGEEKEQVHEVLTRWNALRHGRISPHTGELGKRNPHQASGIKQVKHLPLRQRSKRNDHQPPSVPHHRRNLSYNRQTTPTPENLTELDYVRHDLFFKDPLLPNQWHLVNTQMPEVELNVSKAWGNGIDGRGVKVAIIDDGLDMDSEDLAENFVSRLSSLA